MSMLSLIQLLNRFIWNGPMLLLLGMTHIYFTYRLHFVQRKVGTGIKWSMTPELGQKKRFSSFSALSTTLAATLGTGNIVGVSSAVAMGGPGAIFWCWVTGIFGMATSYAECYLSMLFRKKRKDGSYYGGPMYVLEQGMKSKKMACFYAFWTVLASFGVGCITQSSAITETTFSLWQLSPYFISVTIAILIGIVLMGGATAIYKVCEKLVPAMAVFYIGSCLFLLWHNHAYLLKAFCLIFENAFSQKAFASGVAGGGFMLAARYGIARGLFTNEAGLGSAAIAAASAHTTFPHRQALVSMTAVFWDTVVMCLITGLVIITHLLRSPGQITSVNSLTADAFSVLPGGELLLGISLILFAFATLVGWSYFGKSAMEYLYPKGNGMGYILVYLVMIFVGGIASLDFVWETADLLNAFMAIPNLIALFALQRYLPKE